MKKRCDHMFCHKKYPDGSPLIKGVGTCFIKGEGKGEGKGNGDGKVQWVLSGMERSGEKCGMFNVVGGKCDDYDECLYQVMVDELCQEAKICLHAHTGKNHTGVNQNVLDNCIMGTRKKGKTLIFYANVSVDIDAINAVVTRHNSSNMPSCEQEMSHIAWTVTPTVTTGVPTAAAMTAGDATAMTVSTYLREVFTLCAGPASKREHPFNLTPYIRED
tara:strand:- start:45471 stop:46121 length:651 start_codon:yes stop_codon:yes gene_type:complete